MVISRNRGSKLVLEVVGQWTFELHHSVLLLFCIICFEYLPIDEVAFDQSSTSVEELSFTVLFIKLPKTAIEGAVLTVHFAVSISHVVLVVSFVDVAARPCVDTVSLFFISFELALVFVT